MGSNGQLSFSNGLTNSAPDVIVYLDYHSKTGDGGGDLILDFRTSTDFSSFLQSNLSIQGHTIVPAVGSYIRIKGYYTSKRLLKGCYYRLNLELLKVADYRPILDSYRGTCKTLCLQVV